MSIKDVFTVASKLKEKVDKPKGWPNNPYTITEGGFMDSLKSSSKGLENKGLATIINHNLVELRDKQVIKLFNGGKLTLETYPINPYDAVIDKYIKQGNNAKVLAMRKDRDVIELRDKQIKAFLKLR